MAAQCVTKVELTVSCENLLDKDIGSKSDPLCVLLINSSSSQWYEVSGTPRPDSSSSMLWACRTVAVIGSFGHYQLWFRDKIIYILTYLIVISNQLVRNLSPEHVASMYPSHSYSLQLRVGYSECPCSVSHIGYLWWLHAGMVNSHIVE